MPALSSEVGVEISHAPSLAAFQSSLLYQRPLLWLDIDSKRMYCIVVKTVSSWGKEEVKFTGSFRFLTGAGVGWNCEIPDLWDFYSDLDGVSVFEGTYYPEKLTAKLQVDRDWLDDLVLGTGSEEGEGVAVLLKESDDASLAEGDKSALERRNTEIMGHLTEAVGKLDEVVHLLEGERFDILLLLKGLMPPDEG